ncbi:hypothetical protein [Pseudonocardia acidicola]|uniref:Uncharacterized protein n=1 Tax=Pseudonocardia acidicola TaxID=2724939 RepID=A0ABX1SEQ9_9PSEU|nr:hypothetical protein [Pseudonocardia acidicola]NMH98734.1 hypothetical protein [Pseudonocardia acidicola]
MSASTRSSHTRPAATIDSNRSGFIFAAYTRSRTVRGFSTCCPSSATAPS